MKVAMRSEESELKAQENTYQSPNEGRLKCTVTVGRYANITSVAYRFIQILPLQDFMTWTLF